jgi:hypothetical protein
MATTASSAKEKKAKQRNASGNYGNGTLSSPLFAGKRRPCGRVWKHEYQGCRILDTS